MIIDKRMVWNIYWADPPDPLGKATNICVDTRRVSTTQTPAYDSNLQVHFHDNLWGWRVDGRWKISTWTNLAGSELRGQSSGPPPSPVQASEPVWPLKPSNERRQSIYYIGQIFKLTTCPAQSIEVSSRKLFPSLAACQGWKEIIDFYLNFWLWKSCWVWVINDELENIKELFLTWSFVWQVEWETKGTLTWMFDNSRCSLALWQQQEQAHQSESWQLWWTFFNCELK